MNEIELKSFLEAIKQKINAGNSEKLLKRVFEKTKEIDLKILYDFIGQVLIENPILQEEKNRIKFFAGYNKLMVRFKVDTFKHRIPPRQLLKLEKYFLEKYCIFDGEEILCSFFGLVQYSLKNIFLHDRIFITNNRIIVSDVVRLPATFLPGTGIILMAAINWAKKASQTYKEKSSEPKDIGRVIFGYNFPILHPTDITITIMPQDKKFGMALRDNIPYWKKKMDEEKAYSVRFITQTQPSPCSLAIYVNHQKLIFEAEEEYEDGQKMLYKISEILHTLQ